MPEIAVDASKIVEFWVIKSDLMNKVLFSFCVWNGLRHGLRLTILRKKLQKNAYFAQFMAPKWLKIVKHTIRKERKGRFFWYRGTLLKVSWNGTFLCFDRKKTSGLWSWDVEKNRPWIRFWGAGCGEMKWELRVHWNVGFLGACFDFSGNWFFSVQCRPNAVYCDGNNSNYQIAWKVSF